MVSNLGKFRPIIESLSPEPGPYGPVPWSVRRPRLLWLYVGVVGPASISGVRTFSLPGLLVAGGVIYLMVRGSRRAWWVCLVAAGIAAYSTTAWFSDRSGNWDVNELLALWTGVSWSLGGLLLIAPSVRRFFDLRTRSQALEEQGIETA